MKRVLLVYLRHTCGYIYYNTYCMLCVENLIYNTKSSPKIEPPILSLLHFYSTF